MVILLVRLCGIVDNFFGFFFSRKGGGGGGGGKRYRDGKKAFALLWYVLHNLGSSLSVSHTGS